MAVLVVIDMQTGFTSSGHPKLIQEVISLINDFKRRHQPIFLVEFRYSWYGKTHKSILDVLQGYKRLIRVYKYDNDGSIQVIKAWKRAGLSLDKEFLICGVNASYCVRETAEGILKELQDDVIVRLVRRATNCEDNSIGSGAKRMGYAWAKGSGILLA